MFLKINISYYLLITIHYKKSSNYKKNDAKCCNLLLLISLC